MTPKIRKIDIRGGDLWRISNDRNVESTFSDPWWPDDLGEDSDEMSLEEEYEGEE